MQNKTLIVLDLDNTVIYGSYSESESAELLFKYSKYLKVYKRPGVETLVQFLNQHFDIIVYTTALRNYANKTCKSLHINYKKLYSRRDCKRSGDRFLKILPGEYFNQYEKIIVIDDTPDTWDEKTLRQCEFIVPDEFHGNIEDSGIAYILSELHRVL